MIISLKVFSTREISRKTQVASCVDLMSRRPKHIISLVVLVLLKCFFLQDVQHESLEPVFHLKQFVSRDSPWKVDSESTGVSAKLKQLEHELVNLERIGGNDLLKIPSVLRKQAKIYEGLVERIADLCRKMQTSDPYQPDESSEFKSHRQTEFLVEAFRLQQRASESGQKLIALQSERRNSYVGNDLEIQAKLITTKNSFREIQRKLEIWLARIIGNVEGMLSRDGASQVKENYISRNPFLQQNYP